MKIIFHLSHFFMTHRYFIFINIHQSICSMWISANEHVFFFFFLTYWKYLVKSSNTKNIKSHTKFALQEGHKEVHDM